MRFLPRYYFIFNIPALFLTLLMAVFCLFGNDTEAAEARPRFHATFLQLLDEHNQWPASKWESLCTALTNLEVNEVILQWTLITERPFLWRLTPERRQTVPDDIVCEMPAVKTFFDTARRHGLKVRFGLSHDPYWWQVIKNSKEIIVVYLNRILQDQCRLADTLVNRYGSDSAFSGFYIPQEIDDATWLLPSKRKILVEHLTRLNRYLTALKPDSSAAISCFANGWDAPKHYALFWQNLVKDTGIREVYIQDGVGAGKLAIDEAAIYLKIMTQSVRRAGGLIRPVIEIFQENKVAPQPAPATIERIQRQLVSAFQNCAPDIIAFSLPEYATPQAGKAAESLYNDYKNYLKTK